MLCWRYLINECVPLYLYTEMTYNIFLEMTRKGNYIFFCWFVKCYQYSTYANEIKSIFFNVRLLKPNFPLATFAFTQILNVHLFFCDWETLRWMRKLSNWEFTKLNSHLIGNLNNRCFIYMYIYTHIYTHIHRHTYTHTQLLLIVL